MTPKEKIEKLKKAQEKYLSNLDNSMKKYRTEIKKILSSIDARKLDKVRKGLGI